MMTKGTEEAGYTDLCLGLERMASLYKNKEKQGPGKKKNSPLRILFLIRRMGIRKALWRYRVLKSGVDNILPSATEDLSARSRNYFSSEKIVVYTAEFGGYDELPEPIIQPDNIDYFLISDREPLPESKWKRIDPEPLIPQEYQKDPVLSNRWCKMHPHVIFPQYQYSVYIDANCLVVSDVTDLINRMEDFPVAMFRHKNRDCVYDEIEACIIKKKAPRESLIRHRAVLENHGVPKQYGLAEATVIARKHLEKECIDLMEDWWQAFLAGSGRDQIALIDALWKAGIKPSRITTLGLNLYQCDLFILMPHHKS